MMANATQENHTTSVMVKREPPESGTELKGYASLDAYRGFIMVILVSGSFGFSALRGDAAWGAVARWFDHVPGEGGVFWDIIQPAVMFMVALAMPFALSRRKELGASERDDFRRVLVRLLHLVILSQIIIWVGSGGSCSC